MSLSHFGGFNSFMRFSMFSAVGGITTYYLMNARIKNKVNENDLIIVTGCDSGLGFSIASHCHNQLKMTVVAGVKDLTSKGSEKLKSLFANRSKIFELDITDDTSVQTLVKNVEEIINSNKDLKLYALVNNAGQMVFGEAEWQTDRMIDLQLNVNLRGTIRMSKAFLPLVRQHKSRIINVTSHCALQSLPALSIYGASKAAIKAFTDSLRLELNQYGADATNFIPGGFILQSNLVAKQTEYAAEMKEAFNEEQMKFYEEYFDRYNYYLSFIAKENEPQMIDIEIINRFVDALLESPLRRCYIFEPFRYFLYHSLIKRTPQGISDWLIKKFINMPEYDPSKSIKN